MFNIAEISGKLIVSCQPEAEEPYYTPDFVLGMAQAAEAGGAGGLRLNHPDTIVRVRAQTRLPIIGIWKQQHAGSEVYITPTLAAAQAVVAAGADILALDATPRPRPAEDLRAIVQVLKGQVCLMADISTLEEGLQAAELGFDCLGTTLAGYTPYSRQAEGPDFGLLSQLVAQVSVPVILEGRVWQPAEARQALALGAHAVVVGSAITRPQAIVRHYLAQMQT